MRDFLGRKNCKVSIGQFELDSQLFQTESASFTVFRDNKDHTKAPVVVAMNFGCDVEVDYETGEGSRGTFAICW